MLKSDQKGGRMGSHPKSKRAKKVAWKLDDVDWKRIEHLFPIHQVSPQGGRPRIPNRCVFEALIWFCRAGCPWEYMPRDFPGKSTCQRRLVEWEEQGILKRIHQHLLMLLDEKGRLKLEETFMDGTFVPAKKGANVLEKPRSAKVRK